MPLSSLTANRRQWLFSTSLLAATVAVSCLAQPSKSTQRSPVVAQIVDTSQAHQDVAQDFLIGSRAAWQDINLRGGICSKPVQHVSFETDGTPESLPAAFNTAKNNPPRVVMSGSAGDQLASRLVGTVRQDSMTLAHVGRASSVSAPQHARRGRLSRQL